MYSSKKNLLSLMEFSSDEIKAIISRARDLKKHRSSTDPQVLKNRTGVMIFEKPSLRTRITFETAINELGGHPINLASDTIGMGRRESVQDIARNLERIVHLIIARTFSHQTIEELAKYSSVPVINALTDDFHPCQALAFGQTINERMGDFKKCKIAFIGDGNNVCKSIMILCAKMGYDFTLVSPSKYLPSESFVNSCVDLGNCTGSRFDFTQDMKIALNDAQFIYTDVWTSMGQEKEQEIRRNDFLPYQVNMQVMAMAPSDACVSHCLPAHRGEEITSDVLDSKNSIAFDEAENRLHVQKSVIVHLFS
jgi:ornithine carbamoyltransferase